MEQKLGVTESVAGGITKPEGQKPPEEEVKFPASASKVSPEAKKSYTEEEVQAIVHSTKSEYGREKKALEEENTTLKRQIGLKEQEFADNTTELEKLQAKLDEMTSDDPARFDVVKEMKATREERSQLKADKRELEGSKATHADALQRLAEFETDLRVTQIVEDYQNGDFDKLKDLCSVMSSPSEENMRKIADTLWVKKIELPKTTNPPPVTYSGQTNGGQSQNDSEVINNYANNPKDKQAKQAWLDLMQRRKVRP